MISIMPINRDAFRPLLRRNLRQALLFEFSPQQTGLRRDRLAVAVGADGKFSAKQGRVALPDRIIECHRKADPGQIGHQQHAGGAPDTPECHDGGRDQQP